MRPQKYVAVDYPTVQSEEFLALHNTRSGRIFIMGTGPSLIDQLHLLPKLRAEAVFGCNTLLLWDELPFTPPYFGVTDIYDGWVLDIVEFPGRTMMRFQIAWPEAGFTKSPAFMYVVKAPDGDKIEHKGFQGLDKTIGPLPTGYTSPLSLAQIAAWMGYREFYFLGIEQSKGYCYEPTATLSPTQRSGAGHSGTRYLLALQRNFARARQDVEAAGGAMYDCTPNGFLNETGASRVYRGTPHKAILPYRDLAEVLA